MKWRVALIILLLLTQIGNVFGQDAESITIWISDSIPLDLLLRIDPLFQSGKYTWTNDLDTADLALDFERSSGAVTTEWVYVPVVAFASTAETIRWIDIRRYWNGDLYALSYLTPDGSPPAFITSNETYRAMLSLIGEPDASVPLRFMPTTDSIPDGLWEARPYAWGIMGFNTLTPRTKVLTMDRANVFSDMFDSAAYPLTAHIDLKGDPVKLGTAIEDLLALGTWQSTNRDPSRLGRVVLTGVTALTRAVAYEMERRGITTPADGILYFFEDADLLHTSNEVSFSENCGRPDPYGGVVFCSKQEYFDLLTYIGLDVVELTGNHINDYGSGAFRDTLDWYAANGIATFGGGYTPEDARDAYITTVKGTTVAFIGCNAPGPFGAWATDFREGAAECDNDYLATEIPRLAAEVDLVIVSVQEHEYYQYNVSRGQMQRFTLYASFGADVLIGTQAHQPHGFTIENGVFMHHGLGNLFFDQMQSITTRQMFADKLILYDGRLINVVLFTGLIEEFCCPRPMTAVERADFLNIIFQASGW